jgi:ubiquinone/menaquinone biosynthesis C-methylase UbiE
MNHREVNEVFVTDFLAAGGAGDILDIGTGTAQIPVELCRRLDNCRVMATDYAISMLEIARLNIEVSSLIDRIQLCHADAKQLPHPNEYFDSVMSNSIVHHIPDPSSVLAEAVRVARPGALLFFRDLLRPESEEAVRQLVETYAGQENDHQRQMFENSLRAALTLDEIRALVCQLGYPAETVQATSDRHWTWSTRKPS